MYLRENQKLIKEFGTSKWYGNFGIHGNQDVNRFT